jgi:glycosyltransferase Alg8
MQQRFNEKKALHSFLTPLILYGLIALVLLIWLQPQIYLLKHGVIITLTFFALWRYGWMILNYIRALIYRYFYYPALRRKVNQLPESVKYPQHLYFMIPSYKEDFWVSVECFRSILSEIKSIPSKVTIVVATATPKEDAVIQAMFKAYEEAHRIKLIFQHQNAGKRIAMGHALRTIAREYHQEKFSDPNSVTIFMDGDSYLEEGFLRKMLPFFASEYNLGAVTTNEVAYINSKNRWYIEWFNLKFGQRHILFQAHSLSRKVMTLTGRLSAYRTDIVVKEAFIKQVENDILTDPLHGKFRFLMGDDKSTWFYLLKNGWDMLYLPDILCVSLESRDGKFLQLSRSLPYRWFGNTLRNNTRALKLGPRKMGWYIWYVILDQRFVMWTSLVGVVSALILSFTISPYYLLFFIVWVIFIRLFQLFMISFFGHMVNWRMLLLILYTQWIGALVKIKAFYNLSDQSWSKNSDVQKNKKEAVHIKHPLVYLMPKIAMYSTITLFLTLLLVTHSALKVPGKNLISYFKNFDTANSLQLNAAQNFQKTYPVVIYLKRYGIRPGSKDVAEKINKIVAKSDPKHKIVLQFDEGVYDLYTPLFITRSNIVIQGAGKEKTILLSHIRGKHKSVIGILGKRGKRIGFIEKNIYRNQSHLFCKTKKEVGKYLLVRQPNDLPFLQMLGSKKWFKKYPYLRQEIVKVYDYTPSLSRIDTEKPLLTDFEAQKSEVVALKVVENVELRDFTLKQMYTDAKIESYQYLYENSAPEVSVDAILLEYAANVHIENLNILQSGSHPVHMNYSYRIFLENLKIDGSWNKGKKGNGYVRFARTYYSVFRNSLVRNIRHITLQWSAAGNHIYNIQSGVDINLHGGYAHHNKIDHIVFDIPQQHHWKAIETCPDDARWAPPDGKNDIACDTFRYLHTTNKGLLCSK